MARFSSSDLVVVTRENEVTPGVVVGGARNRVYGTAPTLAPGGNSTTSGVNTGAGGVKGVRAGLRYSDVNIPSELVFQMNDKEFEDVLRDNWPAHELTVGPVALTFAQAGTQVSGATGPTIVAAAGTFGTAGSLFTNPDCVGLMIEITGAAVGAANKWPRRILAVKSDGSQIDLDPTYTAGATGMFGEPLASQSAVTGSINAGRWLRNRGILNNRTVNFEFQYTDQPSGNSFQLVQGCFGDMFKFAINGKGAVTLEFGYKGMDFLDAATASVTASAVIDNPFVSNDYMTSADDLAFWVLNGVNVLSGVNLVSFSCDGNGNASGVDDVAGNRARAGVTLGDLDFTGQLKVYHQAAITTIVQALSRNGGRVPIDWKLQDPAGNRYWFGLYRALLEPNAPKPGAKNARVEGSWNYKTQLGPGGLRTFCIQAFGAVPV